jgi:hypothetical protein
MSKLLIKEQFRIEIKRYTLKYLHINDSITKELDKKLKDQFAKIKLKEQDENHKLRSLKILQLEHQRRLGVYLV